jgi:mono/diheme cytochrome c family protein
MTEIPEHLLARSKARRQAIGQDEGAAAAEAPAASGAVEKAAPAAAPAGPAGVPAMTPAKAPAVAAAAPPPPKRPEVVAAESRKKMPWWAAVAFVSLPAWAFLFTFTLEPPTQVSPVIAAGQDLYSANCGSCHGADGGGGVGPAFADGAVIETFSSYEDHVQWVTLGSAGWREEVGDTYGDPAKPVLGFNGQPMPTFEGVLSEEEILEVVRYEREVISGFGCEAELAEATGEVCAPGTEAEAASP